MIKQLAVWYLRKRNVQLIMNIHFLNESTITGMKNKDFGIYDNGGKDLNIRPDYKEGTK